MSAGDQAGASVRSRVLLSVRADPAVVENPYISLLESSLRPYADVERFSWSAALTGRYDVFHVHWPETLLRARGRARAAAYHLCFALLLMVLRVRRIPVVRTVHNLTPHERGDGWLTSWLLQRLEQRTAARLYLNASSPFDPRSLDFLVRHGTYEDWYGGYPRREAVPGSLVFFGRIRAYKGVERLLEAFAGVPGDLRLAVLGRPETPEIAASLSAQAAADPRVDLQLAAVPDEALVRALTAAEIAVFPYERLYNSGAVLLALSLGRPVLVPAGEVAAELAAEVGEQWVAQYPPPLDAGGLRRGIDDLMRMTRPDRPDLENRDWNEQARWLSGLYRQLVLLSGS